jgi:hypothetical protein
MKIRVPIKLTVYKGDKIITSKLCKLRTRASETAGEFLKQYKAPEYHHECKVVYSSAKDSWSAFDYVSGVDLATKLTDVLEFSLLKELVKCGMMEKEYIR